MLGLLLKCSNSEIENKFRSCPDINLELISRPERLQCMDTNCIVQTKVDFDYFISGIDWSSRAEWDKRA